MHHQYIDGKKLTRKVTPLKAKENHKLSLQCQQLFTQKRSLTTTLRVHYENRRHTKDTS